MNNEMSFAQRDSGKLSSMPNTVRCRKCRMCLHSTAYSIFSIKWSLIILSTALTMPKFTWTAIPSATTNTWLMSSRQPRTITIGWCICFSESFSSTDSMGVDIWNRHAVSYGLEYMLYNNNNNNNNTRTMFMVLSSCCSSIARVHPVSRGECSMAPGARRPLDQADRIEP